MSTSGEQGSRPLTRRELRELRAKGGESAVREALDAAAAEQPTAAPAPHVVASVPLEAEEPRALTRKELRRLRTNEVPIVSPEGAVDAAESEDIAGERHPQSIEAIVVPDDEQSHDDEATDDASSEPAHEPVDDVPERAAEGSGELAEDNSGEVDGDVITAEDPAPAAEDTPDEADASDSTADEWAPEGVSDAPALSPTFGAGVVAPRGEPDAASFDDLMEQYATTSPSSIIMTSSHRLPEGLGSQGAAKGTTDGREVDAVLIDGELPASSSPTPIAASSAISTQKSAHEVLRPPTPEKGRGLLFGLGITAGVLGILAIGTLATLYFTGVFNS
ncbi:hypothetical protein [Microbacterium karelineae]|uniref:hypothetical protein n=1 Tax=Microbacterium karelineae TaxID=2654283 RepID=UPI0012EA442A|nr:hypothetical protein [Microbacterium karelineae]